MWYTYTVKYHSAVKRSEIGLFVVMWMNLESVIDSEVTQKEKTNIVHERIYIESRKVVLTNLFSGQGHRRRYREKTQVGQIRTLGWTYRHYRV